MKDSDQLFGEFEWRVGEAHGGGLSPVCAKQVRRLRVISPAGAPSDPEKVRRGLALLRSLNYEVRYEPPGPVCTRFAATDELRAEEIASAATATDLDAVLLLRGGYGVCRLLECTDWAAVAQSVRRGVRWIGYSDFTSFQMALLASHRAATVCGPMLESDFGRPDGLDPFALSCFTEMMEGRIPEVRWAASPVPRSEVFGSVCEPQWRGVLWGGTLSVLAGSVGTPYFPDIREGLLFIEDVSEQPYRVERLLHQLLYAGVLARQKALLIGSFTDYRPSPSDNGFGLETVWAYLAKKLPDLVLVHGLPFGHISRKCVLVVGQPYCLSYDSGDWVLKNETPIERGADSG